MDLAGSPLTTTRARLSPVHSSHASSHPPLLPPPLAPPVPGHPPPPPDMSLSPSSVYAGVASSVVILGSATSEGEWLVFMPAGDATCDGALAVM